VGVARFWLKAGRGWSARSLNCLRRSGEITFFFLRGRTNAINLCCFCWVVQWNGDRVDRGVVTVEWWSGDSGVATVEWWQWNGDSGVVTWLWSGDRGVCVKTSMDYPICHHIFRNSKMEFDTSSKFWPSGRNKSLDTERIFAVVCLLPVLDRLLFPRLQFGEIPRWQFRSHCLGFKQSSLSMDSYRRQFSSLISSLDQVIA
jgi:hypothetical protein